MPNPILQAMMGRQQQQMNILNLLKNRNPNEVFNQMMQTNPQFKSFVEQNKGKSVEQIAQENNIDMNLLKQFM